MLLFTCFKPRHIIAIAILVAIAFFGYVHSQRRLPSLRISTTISLQPSAQRGGDTAFPNEFAAESRWAEILSVAKKNFVEGTKLIDRISDSDSERAALLAQLFRNLCREDLSKFPNYLRQLPDQRFRQLAFSAVVQDWRRRDPEKLGDFASSRSAEIEYRVALASAIDELRERGNLPAACRLLERMPASSDRKALVGRLALASGRRSLPDALRWVESLNEEERYLATIELLNPVYEQSGSAGLIDFVNQTQDDLARVEAIRRVVPRIVEKTGIDQALEWVESLPRRERQVAQTELAATGARSNLARWTNYALDLADKGSKAAALVAIVQRAFYDDSSVAANWAISLPPDVRDPAVGAAISQWSATDLDGMLRWVRDLDKVDERDSALEEAAYTLAGRDLHLVIQLANEISASSSKGDVLAELGGRGR